MGRRQAECCGGEARSTGPEERQAGCRREGGGDGAWRGRHEGNVDERGVKEYSGRCRWPATRFLPGQDLLATTTWRFSRPNSGNITAKERYMSRTACQEEAYCMWVAKDSPWEIFWIFRSYQISQ
jgi:hypothetical protein